MAIAAACVEIFSLIGPPMLLQCDNGREFSGLAGKARGKALRKKAKSVDLSGEVSMIRTENGRIRTGNGSAITGNGMHITGCGMHITGNGMHRTGYVIADG